MTNHPSRVGVANQVSFLVEVNDLKTTISTTTSTPTNTLNEKSYPDYSIGKGYHVKKTFKDWKTSKGFFVFRKTLLISGRNIRIRDIIFIMPMVNS